MVSYIEGWQKEFVEPNGIAKARGSNAIRLRQLYESLANLLYSQYEPTKRVSSRVSRDFLQRLDAWLGCFETDEQRWIAFQSIEYLFFAGQQEFEELYRCAYEHSILPWLIDRAGIDLFSERLDKLLANELATCWPCPVTDSLRINGFLHVTGLRGRDLRPDWLSLRELGHKDRVASYVQRNGIKYLVLVEDFVGSGNQFCRALNYAVAAFDGPILLVPLIVCAPGDRTIKRFIKRLARGDITYRPQIVLQQSCLVGPTAHPDEPSLFAKLRNVIASSQIAILDGNSPGGRGEEFGYKKVGSMVVLYSNCPNNTPPIYHKWSKRWRPPFPRSARV